jgi:hypothetical protein
MAAVIPLGKFTQVPLREAWPNEGGNFTPWLAKPENLKLLAEALGLGELQDQQTEVPVGKFLIDILAVDGYGDPVVIENQLEQTDHSHLGQLSTYLAGQEGKATIVWIAEIFRDEHRAAIDWLNANTVEDYTFFGVVVELWRIGNSPPAPRFNIVAKPNDWTRNVRDITRETSDSELAERHRTRLAYWQSFADFLRTKHSTFSIKRPTKNALYRFPLGRPGFRIMTRIGILNQNAVVGLSISRDPERAVYKMLCSQKVAIEAEFGEPLNWDEKPGNKRSLISVTRTSVNPADKSQYEDVHAWMLMEMEKFRTTFEARVLALPPVGGSHGQDEPDEGEE